MNDYTPYIKELVKENLKTLIEDNEEEIVKYLSLKGYHFRRPPRRSTMNTHLRLLGIFIRKR